MVLNSNTEIYGVGNIKRSSNLAKNKINKKFGFKYPMGDIDSGTFLKKSSGLELVKGQLKQLLLTSRGERVMLPGYGCNLRRYIMEPLDQATLSQIRRDILECFSRYAPNISVVKIQVFPSTNETLSGGHAAIIKLVCVLQDLEDITFELKLDL